MCRRACIWRGPAFAGLNLVVQLAVDTLVDEVFGQLVDADGDRFLAALFTTAPRPLAAADVTARVREAQDAFLVGTSIRRSGHPRTGSAARLPQVHGPRVPTPHHPPGPGRRPGRR